MCAPVAQLDRAPDYESGGQEFESLRVRHLSVISYSYLSPLDFFYVIHFLLIFNLLMAFYSVFLSVVSLVFLIEESVMRPSNQSEGAFY